MRGDKMRGSLWAATLFATFLSLSSSVHAANAIRIERHGNWSVYKYDLGERSVCFAATPPSKVTSPKGVKRRHIRAYVATWPAANNSATQRNNEVSFHVGRKMAAASLTIDGKTFSLFAKGENAYVTERAKELQLVTAMRAGKAMAISTTSSDGTTTRDLYSLAGVTAALKAAQQRCSTSQNEHSQLMFRRW